MATFGEFIRGQREDKGLNQSDFGQQLGIIMTDVSKIENGKKGFPFDKLERLAKYLNMDYSELKTQYVAERLVNEAHKYKCPDKVFSVAESQSKYVKSKELKGKKRNSNGLQ